MKNRKKSIAASILCLSIFSLFLNGCGKKGDDSTAIAITPTPSDTTVAASETPTATPAASLNETSVTSTNTSGTSTPFVASGNMATNNSISSDQTDSANKITGTIVAASMEDVTVRTSEGVEYTCSTTNAVNNLNDGITLGNNITVTLSSMSAVNGLYTATELNEISSAQTNTNIGVENTENTVNDGTDSSGIYDNSQYSDGTYDYSTYNDTTYDDGTYSDYDDSTIYDTSGEDYYYYDPATDIYDGSAAY